MKIPKLKKIFIDAPVKGGYKIRKNKTGYSVSSALSKYIKKGFYAEFMTSEDNKRLFISVSSTHVSGSVKILTGGSHSRLPKVCSHAFESVYPGKDVFEARKIQDGAKVFYELKPVK